MRRALADDTPTAYRRLAEIGYATVAVSGRHGHTTRELRRLADDVGLGIVLEHVGYDRLGDRWDEALEDVATLGGSWVVVPSLPERLHTPDGFREAAEAFNLAGAAARKAGLGLLFHNHGTDFASVDGEVLYDVLLAGTDPELVGLLMDVYWCVEGGADPASYFREHPGRFPVLHVKDRAPDGSFADVGAGELDLAAMFAHAGTAGVQQFLVEHDEPVDEWETAGASYAHLAGLEV